jgi:hypothetical protein
MLTGLDDRKQRTVFCYYIRRKGIGQALRTNETGMYFRVATLDQHYSENTQGRVCNVCVGYETSPSKHDRSKRR